MHATSALPVWLWSTDGARVLWANPAGAKWFGATNSPELARRTFGPADAHRRQVAQFASRLPASGAMRLERLRGFGAEPGMLMACRGARFDFADGSHGVLIAAVGVSGRSMPLEERLRHLVEGAELPMASFSRDGTLVGASEAARPLFGFLSLAEGGLEAAANEALASGRSEAPSASGQLTLQRVGSGLDTALIGLITPIPTRTAAAAELPHEAEGASCPGAAADEQPASSNEAPAEFALIDEFDAPADQALDARSEGGPDAASPEEACPPVEIAGLETSTGAEAREPSPYVEPVADEPSAESASVIATPAPAPVAIPAWLDEIADNRRQHPLRFTWQIDETGRFLLRSEDFIRLIGPRAAESLSRPWRENAIPIDPEGHFARAVATHNTWTGVKLNWPTDGSEPLPVELSGLPVLNRAQEFAGYRGFGICRDLDALARLATWRRSEWLSGVAAPAAFTDLGPAPGIADVMSSSPGGTGRADAHENSPQDNSPRALLDEAVETPPNVVPFRPAGEGKSPVLTPVENSAFDEIARQLAARLERNEGTADAAGETGRPAAEAEITGRADGRSREQAAAENDRAGATQMPNPPPEWLAPSEPPARGEAKRDRTLLDLLPSGVLIYRLDRLLYANPAFLEQMGYPSLHALEQDGGLDALYVEPGVSSASSTSEAGTPVRISATDRTEPTDARLFTISWDGESALALMLSARRETYTASEPDRSGPADPEPVSAPPAGHAEAEDLAAILDTTAEGIVMFDAAGSIHACNRSAEALFGYDGTDFLTRKLSDLFAPESRPAVLDYFASIKEAAAASLLDPGRDVLGHVSRGGLIPLSMTMGRTRANGPNFFAVFRDLSHIKKGESDLQQARRLADRAANAKADMLARISHEVRSPLNAIIGFADVMIAERFGAIGNERYVEYLKDIRASGERMIAILNDLTELSRIESGKLDLSFGSQNLNELVESCVSMMQPQANRERIIIRTSLGHMLPPVVADARALRQITMNLIGNSIHLANPGGQVIVSTAFSDLGQVVLRVRDTGHGLNDNEVAAALEPFRTSAPSDHAADSSAVSLSLTKALVEANRAQFHIRTGGRSGTLIEVVFVAELVR